MSSSFKIATQAAGVAGLTALDALAAPVRLDPQFLFEPYTKRLRLGNGNYLGIGAPAAEWSFPQLTLAERNSLATYCTTASAAVYITTPKANGTFTNYLAIMRLPETEPPIKAGYLQGYVIRFEQLVEQTP